LLVCFPWQFFQSPLFYKVLPNAWRLFNQHVHVERAAPRAAEGRNQRECALGNSPFFASAERMSCRLGWIVVHFPTATGEQKASLDEANILFLLTRVLEPVGFQKMRESAYTNILACLYFLITYLCSLPTFGASLIGTFTDFLRSTPMQQPVLNSPNTFITTRVPSRFMNTKSELNLPSLTAAVWGILLLQSEE
jgi:hypothetical protein